MAINKLRLLASIISISAGLVYLYKTFQAEADSALETATETAVNFDPFISFMLIAFGLLLLIWYYIDR